MNDSRVNPRPRFLDCTFRDGGYYTDWDFDPQLTASYFDRLSKLPISIIEPGYLNVPLPGYFGQYYFLSAPLLEEIKSRLAPSQQLAVMLNAKSFDVETVGRVLEGLSGTVDIVRIASAPSDLVRTRELGAEVRSRGFGLSINVMHLSRFGADLGVVEGLREISQVAQVVSLVDSFGACEPDQVRGAVSQAREMFPGAEIGFHGHDNMGLAFANSLAAVDAGASVIDGTITGMGRGAGNTRTEMLLVHEASRTRLPLDFDALTSVVEEFDRLKSEYRWGPHLPYMISGASDLPQKDVMDWVGKNRYSVVSIVRALHGDRSGGLDDRPFPPLVGAGGHRRPDEVVLVGGGSTVGRHIQAIREYIEMVDSPVVHANFRHLALQWPGVKQFICLAGDGVTRLPPEHQRKQVTALVVPEPPRLTGLVPGDDVNPIVQVAPFELGPPLATLGPVSDIGPLSLALGAALALGVKRISLVGFDGYQNATSAQQDLSRETQSMFDSFRASFPDIEVSALTPSAYDLPASSVYSRLAELM